METALSPKQQKLRDYMLHPDTFIEEQLEIDVWSGMRLIIDTVWHNEYTTVRACHGISKTYAAAAIAVAFLNLFPQSVIITTAPTNRQVEKLLWKEIGAMYKKSGAHLFGNITQLNIKVAPDWFMIGFSTDRQTSAEGVHAPRVLWVLDEAKGLPAWVYKAIDGSFTGGFTRALEISTTDGADQQCEFRRHHEKDRGKWHGVHLSAMDSPFIDPDRYPQHQRHINAKLYEYGKPEHGTEWPIEKAKRIQVTTDNWMNDRIADWEGTEDHLIETKVWGGFSTETSYNIIPLDHVMAAVEAPLERGQNAEYGLDVARMGDDQNVLTKNRTGLIEWQKEWGKVDTMETTGIAMHEVKSTEIVKIDSIGVGAGVYDRMAELGQPVVGLNSSQKAFETETYFNLRAEMWFHAREVFRQQFDEGDTISIPDDPELIEELTGMRYLMHSDGRYRVEKKEDYKKRLERSPDHADSLVYALYPIPLVLEIEAEQENLFENAEDVGEGVYMP